MRQNDCPHDFVSYSPDGSDKKFECGDCGERFVTLPEEMPEGMIRTGFDMKLIGVLHKFTIGETTVGRSYYESKLRTKNEFTQYLDEFLPMVPIYRDIVGCGTPNTRVKVGEHKRKSDPFEVDSWFAKIDERAMKGNLTPMVSDVFSDVQSWHYLDDDADSNGFVMVRFIDNTKQRVLLDWTV
jgi:hypothetical protein